MVKKTMSLLQRGFESILVNAHLVVIVLKAKHSQVLLFNMPDCIGRTDGKPQGLLSLLFQEVVKLQIKALKNIGCFLIEVNETIILW